MDPDNHPFPFMLNLPFQYYTSEGHDDDFDGSVLIPNPTTMDSFDPRNQLNQEYDENTTMTMEGLQYAAMRALNLSSNPSRNTTSSTNYYDQIDGSERKLSEIRIRAAIEATAQRMQFGNHQRRRSLELVKGRVVSMAKDHYGCRLLQTKIDEGKPDEIEMILSEVKDHLHDLMRHTFGNYLIQKIFQVTNSVTVQQINIILFFIIVDPRKLKDVCIDSHGTRVVQKILENINTQQISAIVGVLKHITVSLMKNVNGSYVIERCVKLFPPKYKKVILDEVAKNCVDIATNRWGCSAIQRCWVHDEGEAIFLLVQELILNAAVLAEDPYGNYMLQFLVKLKKPAGNRLIIERLRGTYAGLSVNKHASNVVEALLIFSKLNDAAIIVLELMNSPEFLNILQDPYGNFVAQKALEYTKGPLRRRLFNMILSNDENLEGHIYGARVLTFVKKHRVHV